MKLQQSVFVLLTPLKSSGQNSDVSRVWWCLSLQHVQDWSSRGAVVPTMQHRGFTYICSCVRVQSGETLKHAGLLLEVWLVSWQQLHQCLRPTQFFVLFMCSFHDEKHNKPTHSVNPHIVMTRKEQKETFLRRSYSVFWSDRIFLNTRAWTVESRISPKMQ